MADDSAGDDLVNVDSAMRSVTPLGSSLFSRNEEEEEEVEEEDDYWGEEEEGSASRRLLADFPPRLLHSMSHSDTRHASSAFDSSSTTIDSLHGRPAITAHSLEPQQQLDEEQQVGLEFLDDTDVTTHRPTTLWQRIRRFLSSWSSTLVVLWILLNSEAVRGITIPTQAEYVNTLGGDESFLGLTVGAFSGGRLAMTVLLGIVSAFFTYKTIFISTSALLIIANFIYALAGVTGSKWVIFVARIFLGLGAGTLSIVRAYFAETYAVADRTTILAVVAAVQYGGFALFPGVGDLVEIIFGYSSSTTTSPTDATPIYLYPNVTDSPFADAAPGTSTKGKLIDNFTAPAWLMLCFSIISIILVLVWFDEPEQEKKIFHLKDLIPFYKPQLKRITEGAIGNTIRKALGLPMVAPAPEIASSFPSGLSTSSSQSIPTSSSGSEGHTATNPAFTSFEASYSSSSNDRPPFLSALGKNDSDSNLEDIGMDGSPRNGISSESSNDDVPYHLSFNDHNDTEMLDMRRSGASPSLTSPSPNHMQSQSRSSFDSSRISIDSTSSSDAPKRHQRQLVTIIWISFLAINFLIRVVLGTIETLGATLYHDVTQKLIVPPATVFSPTSGTFYTILGVVGVAIVLVLALVARKVPDHITFIASLASLLFGSLFLIGNLATMSLARFTIGSGLMYSFGYPLAQSIVVSMFSKIPASARSQSASMSWIGSVGSVGRIIGPLIAGAIFQHSGNSATWIFNSSIGAVLLVQAAVTLHFMWKIE